MLLFIKVPFSFFPDSDKKGFVINLWNPEGTDIEYTNKISETVENEVLKQDGIISVTSAIGASPSRYYIATIPELPNTALSQLIISVKNLKDINKISETVKNFVDNNFPDTRVEIRKYANGMPTRYPIQLRIIGNDPNILREYSNKFSNILRNVEGADNIQTDWKEKQLVIKPELDKVKERESLVTSLDIATSLNRSINGLKIGTFKDGEENISVLFKEKNDSREFNINNLGQVSVWGLGFKSIPFRELIKKENLVWENPIIVRKDGFRAIQVQADVKSGYRVEDVRKRFAQQ
ncbi:Acriflavin resistance plasma membrane protein [Fusobacterium vincentii ATCC 49256]|uniref:Acriflavin resistance plasma membrane protein n=1 Tax=Fusobacterium vincentii ATCC 49256 TaxID=209882 RepID=Q7P3G7_FUSVC|nr:Acriflavin resistance plasma membrane protein [Fusobacterium vincentii ATCC 49256]